MDLGGFYIFLFGFVGAVLLILRLSRLALGHERI
jgi:hypothetical protein